jgi:hypothetical protein
MLKTTLLSSTKAPWHCNWPSQSASAVTGPICGTTIDSLDLILGRTDAARLWHPQDGRITELGLHCQVDSDLGNDVLIAIAACPI